MGPGLLIAAAGLGGLMLYAKSKGAKATTGSVSDDVATQNLAQASAMLYTESRAEVLIAMADLLDNQAANASSTMAQRLSDAAEALRNRAAVLKAA